MRTPLILTPLSEECASSPHSLLCCFPLATVFLDSALPSGYGHCNCHSRAFGHSFEHWFSLECARQLFKAWTVNLASRVAELVGLS